MASFSGKKSHLPPETVVGEDGSSKRNIIRRHGGEPRDRKAGIPGKSIDDGSLYYDPAAMNEDDPNYDSADDGGRFAPSFSALHRQEIAKSKLTLTAFKKVVQPIIDDFFATSDVDEVVKGLLEINAPEYGYEFVKRLINGAIDREDSRREQTSRLLSILYPDFLSSDMIGKGFERLFELIDEIQLDAPQASGILSSFVARAVIDEVLPPSFLKDNVVCNLGGDIIDHAKLLLSRDHAGTKLERIWGPGDGRPVEELKTAVAQLVEEYLMSTDLIEAERCLRDLHAPQFFHEVVKRAVTIAMDKTEDDQLNISRLLQALSSTGLLTQTQAQVGFNRLFGILPDLLLDVPMANHILNAFVSRAINDDVLPREYTAPTSTEAV